MMNGLLKEELSEVRNIQFEIYTGEMEEDEAKERFKITNLESANWALRKLAAINAKEKEINDLKEKEISRIENWAQDELKKLAESKQFFEGLLTEYFMRERKKDPKFKISTPYGKVTARKQLPKWHYDEDKLIKWLLQNDKDLLRVKYEPDKNEIKKKYKVVGPVVVSEDGEIVEGITIEERPEAINIKVEV